MLAVSSTEVRKDFGSYIDKIVRSKPIFIKRSRDYFMGISIEMAKELTKDILFYTDKYIEEDGSITLAMQDIDIVVNGETEEIAKDFLIADLREYANDYYEDIEYWSSDLNRKKQLRSILKVLLSEDDNEIKDSVICQVGES